MYLRVSVLLMLLVSLIFVRKSIAQSASAERILTVNMNQIKGKLNKSFNTCVGAGRANEGLRADWQRQLRYTREECGFKYIRFHGLLTDDMGVYKEDKAGNPVYNWQYIDELIDFLQRIGMKPFVELGFMPEALASGKQTVFWWRGNITPPKDYRKWDDLITHLLKHWTERYGKAEVSTWYFEVWNEPNLKNLFFSGNQQDYFKLYEETAKTIKAFSPSYRVGGPATAGNAWIDETIRFCVDNKVPIDFISSHTYGVRQGFLDLSGDVGTIISQDKHAVSGDMIRSRQIIDHSALPHLELHYTEWSASYTPTDPIHDTYEEAAYILDKVKNASPYVQSMSYWTFTDIFEEQGPRMTPFHGGFGLMNYQDIKKPAFYAFQFLNSLGKYELTITDSSAIACKDDAAHLQVLFWNYTIDHPNDSVNDQIFYKKDLPAKSVAPVRVKLQQIPPGRYKLEVYQSGYQVNDAYATYLAMHSPTQLTLPQVAALKQASNGKAITAVFINVPASGRFERAFPMRQNDVYFLKLTKI